jgi:transposase-like protein
MINESYERIHGKLCPICKKENVFKKVQTVEESGLGNVDRYHCLNCDNKWTERLDW